MTTRQLDLIRSLQGLPGQPETRVLAVINSSHMTRLDNDYAIENLFDAEGVHSVGQHAVTFFAYGHVSRDKPGWMSDMLWRNLCKLAVQGFERVELDGDAPVVAGLETSDW
jgi:hypothetical protein